MDFETFREDPRQLPRSSASVQAEKKPPASEKSPVKVRGKAR
jgi:hypothetical protein